MVDQVRKEVAPGVEGNSRKQTYVDTPPTDPEQVSRPDSLRGGEKWHAKFQQNHPDDGYFQATATDHQRLTQTVDTLLGIQAQRDPRKTAAQHQESVNQHAEGAARKLEERFPEVVKRHYGEISAAKNQLREDLGIKRESAHAKEIRDRLMGMSDSARSNAIQQAVERGDAQVMAALANAPSFLSGMEDAQRDALVEQYQTKHAPQAVKRIRDMLASAERLEDAYAQAPEFLRSLVDRSHEPGMQKAQTAADKFGDSLKSL